MSQAKTKCPPGTIEIPVTVGDLALPKEVLSKMETQARARGVTTAEVIQESIRVGFFRGVGDGIIH